MATVYIDSAASGADNGTSWTDAYNSIESYISAGPAAGDLVYIDDGHSETLTNPYDLSITAGTFAAPIRILCVDKADDSLSTGATINHADEFADDTLRDVYVYGMTFGVLNDVIWSNVTFENCTLNFTKSTAIIIGEGGDYADVTFIGGTLDLSGSSSITTVFGNFGEDRARLHMIGTTYTKYTSQTDVIVPDSNGDGIHATFEGMDLSAFTSVFTWGAPPVQAVVRGCKVSSTMAADIDGTRTNANSWCLIVDSAVGNLSAAAQNLVLYDTYYGRITTEETIVLDASDGDTTYSFKIVTSGNVSQTDGRRSVLWLPFPLDAWVTGGSSLTFKVEFTQSGTVTELDDDEIFPAILGPDANGTPTGQKDFRSGWFDDPWNGSPNTHATSSEAWGGGTDTPQYMTDSYTPAETGTVYCQVGVAIPSTTLYLNPLLDVA